MVDISIMSIIEGVVEFSCMEIALQSEPEYIFQPLWFSTFILNLYSTTFATFIPLLKITLTHIPKCILNTLYITSCTNCIFLDKLPLSSTILEMFHCYNIILHNPYNKLCFSLDYVC
jgi:hypothetical protein